MSNVPDKKQESPYIVWNDDSDLEKTAGNIDSYDGILSANASHRTYLDIEPNISVRTSFNKSDYYRFREDERPEVGKKSIRMCMDAYEKVGIIKNVIDLMGDFASQGIMLYHENKRTENFYRKWWNKVGGAERSERFLNILYRCGNVIINKRHGKITKKNQREMSKANEFLLETPKTFKRTIPLKYDFLNPLTINVKGGQASLFAGKPIYTMRISPSLHRSLMDGKNKDILKTLPEYIRKAVTENKNEIILDPQKTETFFYKKDDWQLWANPMINAIIDDIIMLEKMKLADMSALDGAISNIRLWNVGSLDHKILPNKGAIDKLRNILASNVGGGTMDLVWGPELSYTESNSQIYKFLGTEKYQPVLNSIYAGLGIPPTLTGLAGQNGGFTNNFISLKTLIERLEYGRELLREFWSQEIYYIQKAMGFAKPAELHFEYMILSDEAAEKNLLIQLADRDIISVETLREKLGVLNNIESVRLTKEGNLRDKNKMPLKADPYHNANVESEFAKIALQKGEIGIEDVTDIKPSNPAVLNDTPKEQESNKPIEEGGRPKFSKDQGPRKQRRVLPKDTPSTNVATLSIWANEAQKKLSDIINPFVLSHYNKKNLRELSKHEVSQLESIKFRTLCALTPYQDIDESTIAEIMSAQPEPSKAQIKIKDDLIFEFIQKNDRTPSLDEARQIYNMSYSFSFLT